MTTQETVILEEAKRVTLSLRLRINLCSSDKTKTQSEIDGQNKWIRCWNWLNTEENPKIYDKIMCHVKYFCIAPFHFYSPMLCQYSLPPQMFFSSQNVHSYDSVIEKVCENDERNNPTIDWWICFSPELTYIYSLWNE